MDLTQVSIPASRGHMNKSSLNQCKGGGGGGISCCPKPKVFSVHFSHTLGARGSSALVGIKITETCRSNTTIIFLNEELHYPDGYEVQVEPEISVKWHSNITNYMFVEHNAALMSGHKVNVFIEPKHSENKILHV